MKRSVGDDRINLFGMWVPESEIEQTEQLFGGKLVRDAKLNNLLSWAVRQIMKQEGRMPDEVKVRDRPFKLYIPVRIEAEIFGTGFKSLMTNRFLFIEIQRRFVL